MHSHARKSYKSFAHGNVPIEDASDLSLVKVHPRPFSPGSDSAVRRLNGLVEEKRLANVFYLGNCAFQVKRF
jgi:hypothetical protein